MSDSGRTLGDFEDPMPAPTVCDMPPWLALGHQLAEAGRAVRIAATTANRRRYADLLARTMRQIEAERLLAMQARNPEDAP